MLILNGGSSSIKFAVFTKSLQKSLSGKIDRIGTGQSTLSIAGREPVTVAADSVEAAADFLMKWLTENNEVTETSVAVHRLVHGMDHRKPERVTRELLGQLKTYIPFDPEHLPGELKLIEIVNANYPGWKQVACFDTAFHATMPELAQRFPLPGKYYEMGIRRYGFHGISYSYVLKQLIRIAGDRVQNARVILAHLGNGASMVAIKNGKSIDTTMGFTPAGGLMMGTRSGDLDPGITTWLLEQQHLSSKDFSRLINHESGLIGVSGISSDMKNLIDQKDKQPTAKLAIDLFCYEAKKWLGALTATLGGLDYFVFTGGMGQNAPLVRSKICSGMEYLGITIDEQRNEKNEQLITADHSTVAVYMIPTDEEQEMAETVNEWLATEKNK